MKNNTYEKDKRNAIQPYMYTCRVNPENNTLENLRQQLWYRGKNNNRIWSTTASKIGSIRLKKPPGEAEIPANRFHQQFPLKKP